MRCGNYSSRVLTLVFILAAASSCTKIRSFLVGMVSSHEPEQQISGEGSTVSPTFDETDAKYLQLKVQLEPVKAQFTLPTDIQFLPGEPHIMLVAEKNGTLKWHDLKTSQTGTLLTLNVLTVSEQGLLGVAFHPQFSQSEKLYLNYVTKNKQGQDITRVSEWQWPKDFRNNGLTNERVLLEVEQPYPNHNAGQLAFGPDGCLYIGFGDGGWRDDPHGNGQDPETFLGSMLRIRPEKSVDGKPYTVPADNPFLGKKNTKPEIWATGLRNPWRYSFDPLGRLIVADVGQNKFEEISIVEKGGNYGWKRKEGFHCFEPDAGCEEGVSALLDPVFEYGREEGISVTGGYVYTADSPSLLKGKYIFGDFGSGRIWAMALPKNARERVANKQIVSLGKWPMALSTFGRDPSGSVYVADFGRGQIFKIREFSEK